MVHTAGGRELDSFLIGGTKNKFASLILIKKYKIFMV